jgi:hypothetical protein
MLSPMNFTDGFSSFLPGLGKAFGLFKVTGALLLI